MAAASGGKMGGCCRKVPNRPLIALPCWLHPISVYSGWFGRRKKKRASNEPKTLWLDTVVRGKSTIVPKFIRGPAGQCLPYKAHGVPKDLKRVP